MRSVVLAILPISVGGSIGPRPWHLWSYCNKRHNIERKKKTSACFRCDSHEHFFKDYPDPPLASFDQSQNQASVRTLARDRGQG